MNRQVRAVPAGATLRIQAAEPFILHWSRDEWSHVNDTRAAATSVGISFTDIGIAADERAPIRFTFRWLDPERWEGRDYIVEVRPG